MRTIRDGGYQGRIGILNHTNEDAEGRLLDNRDGLEWLVPQLDGKTPGTPPKLRTYTPSAAIKADASGALTSPLASPVAPPQKPDYWSVEDPKPRSSRRGRPDGLRASQADHVRQRSDRIGTL